MYIEIDFNSHEAIYVQLRNQIVVLIAQDKLQEGQSLPSVRQMAEELKVNMHTVNKAYNILKQEGYLKLDRRNGAVIALEMAAKTKEVEMKKNNIQMIVAESICKGISEAEMHSIVSEVYGLFLDGNERKESDYEK